MQPVSRKNNTATRPAKAAVFAFASLAALLPGAASAAAPETDTELNERVRHALDFTSRKLDAKTLNTQVSFHWIGSGDQVWFRKALDNRGNQFVLVDAANGRQKPLFDEARMTAALTAAGAPLTDGVPRVHDLVVAGDGRTLTVKVPRADARCNWPQLYDACTLPVQEYACDLPVTACSPSGAAAGDDVALSPDRRWTIRAQDHNLWLHDLRGGGDRRLTDDGVEDYAWGKMHNQLETFAFARRRTGTPDPIEGVHWSPDGRYVLALRHDVRPYDEHLIQTEYVPPEGGPPVIHTKRQAAADDAEYPRAQLAVISVSDGRRTIIDVDPHLFEDTANILFAAGRIWWNTAGDEAWLIGAKRGGRELRLLHLDLKAGTAKTIVIEASDHPISLHPANGAPPNIAILPASNRFIWYSERDGWGHLYLGELSSGRILRQLTKGPWLVTDLLRVDEASGRLFFAAAGREKGRNPYYRHLYRMSMDGGAPLLLTPEDADHAFGAEVGGSLSPNGRYFVDDFSTVSEPDRYVLRRTDGSMVADVASADISQLRAAGWLAPERVTVKAADGVTDLYGVIYKPQSFDPAKRYPVVEITYPGTWSKYNPTTFRQIFYGSAVMNAYAFANAGAIVVSIDGRGTSYRSAAFRNFVYGQDDATGAADHVAAIRNLARDRPWMDLSRIGVTGHSSGGDGSLRAAMLYPDFFKVVVSGEGPTDYLTLPMDIAIERPLGVPDTPDVRSYYERIATKNMASRLKADQKVLVIYSGGDEEVPLEQGFKIFKAFQDASFVYDELIIADAGHWGGRDDYGVMRTVRYFAQNLGRPEPVKP